MVFKLFELSLEEKHPPSTSRAPRPTCKANLLLGFIYWGEKSPIRAGV